MVNKYGPELEKRGISLDGGNATVKSQVNGAQAMAPAANPAAPAAAIAAAGNAGGAPAAGNKFASVDAGGLDKVADRLHQVAHVQLRAANASLRSMNFPGANLGGAVEPHRA